MRVEDLLEKLRIQSYPSGRDDFQLLISRPNVESKEFKEVLGLKVDSDKKVVFLIVE